MTVHFFTKGGPRVASSRQRAFLVAHHLRLHGVSALLHEPPFPDGLRTVLAGDIIYLQRTIYDLGFVFRVVLHSFFSRNPIIFDFDDACYLHSPFRVRLLMLISHAVVVGSHTLERWALTRHPLVVRIPTLVDPRDYERSAVAAPSPARIVLGWIGLGPDHCPDLALLVPVARILADRQIPVSLMIVGTLGDPRISALFASVCIPVEFVPDLDWTDPSLVCDALSSFDIGLAPLRDTPWNRGKGAFKIIQYMASGIPTVASPVGENAYAVEGGVTGFLADTPEAFADAVCRLVASPNLRRSFGNAGQRAVRARFSYESWISRYVALLSSLSVGSGPR